MKQRSIRFAGIVAVGVITFGWLASAAEVAKTAEPGAGVASQTEAKAPAPQAETKGPAWSDTSAPSAAVPPGQAAGDDMAAKIKAFQAAREKYLENAKKLSVSERQAQAEEREKIRQQLKENREKFLAEQKVLREELRKERREQVVERLKELHEKIESEKDKVRERSKGE